MSEAGSVKVLVRAMVVALMLVSIVVGHAFALESPYVQTGSIQAFDADGNPIVVSYYDPVGGHRDYPRLVGDVNAASPVWAAGPDGGPVPISFYTPIDSSCSPVPPWPLFTGPDPQARCWDIVFNPGNSTPGTYGINVPLTTTVNGETQVFDHWTVTDGIVDGHCRAGDVGVMAINLSSGAGGVPTHSQGAEYRIWTDLNNGVGMNAAFEAHYERVSPDTTAPLLVMGDTIECATVERGDPLVPAFACTEPGSLGSGVASCILEDESGVVASGESLDTSTLGIHSYTLTATDNAGNERSRTATYTVVEGATTLADSSVGENLDAGTAVGDFATSNADPGETWTYELVAGDGADDNASFTIDGGTLRTTEVFDYEVRSAYSIRVRVTEMDTGFSDELVFPITIEDSVGDVTVTPSTVAENEPVGTVVATLFDMPPFANVRGFMSLVSGYGDDDNALFEVRRRFYGQGGSADDLVTAATFDYESRSTYRIRLRQTIEGVVPPIITENSVTITVTDANDAPVAVDGQVTTNEDEPVDIPLLLIASDQDGDTLRATVDSVVPHGLVTVVDGVATYVPDPDYHGPDSFEYRVCDLDQACDRATISLMVGAVNDRPTADDDAYQVASGVPLSVTAPGVLDGDADVEGAALTAALAGGPAHASAFTLDADGSFSYTSTAGFAGTDSFTYRASDGDLESEVATVTINVTPGNQAPTISATGGSCTSDTAPKGTLTVRLDDAETPAASLVLAASRSGVALPSGSATIAGTGATRTVTISAKAQKAVAAGVVTLTVTDADGRTATLPVTVTVGSSKADTIAGGDGVDMVFGLNDADLLTGGSATDILCGGKGNDVLRGLDGGDVLDGGAGGDTLEGGEGADVLLGGGGNDVLRGEGGADRFTGGAGKDVYADYSAADGDSRTEAP
jgi:Ca2+-binding RTX toxin-like protein